MVSPFEPLSFRRERELFLSSPSSLLCVLVMPCRVCVGSKSDDRVISECVTSTCRSGQDRVSVGFELFSRGCWSSLLVRLGSSVCREHEIFSSSPNLLSRLLGQAVVGCPSGPRSALLFLQFNLFWHRPMVGSQFNDQFPHGSSIWVICVTWISQRW